MYELYELKRSDCVLYSTSSKYTDVEIVKPNSKVFEKSIKERIHSLYWNLITFGKAKIYVIRDDAGSVIHSSYVIPKCMKFPFMRRKYHDIEIGPCTTSDIHRGQGLYPYVLTKIISNELGENDIAYMIVDDKNIPSIRGIQKIGFICTASVKKDRFKRYVVERYYRTIQERNK